MRSTHHARYPDKRILRELWAGDRVTFGSSRVHRLPAGSRRKGHANGALYVEDFSGVIWHCKCIGYTYHATWEATHAVGYKWPDPPTE
jgi:hypothetical protein